MEMFEKNQTNLLKLKKPDVEKEHENDAHGYKNGQKADRFCAVCNGIIVRGKILTLPDVNDRNKEEEG